MPHSSGWLSGPLYCNLPATGIGGRLAYMGPRQPLTRSLGHDGEHRGSSGDSTRPCNSLIKRPIYFALSAGAVNWLISKSLRPRFAFAEPDSITRIEKPGLPCSFASTCVADQVPPSCRSP